MGFSKDGFVSYNTILERANTIGLKPMTFEIALALREQFLNQPDYSTEEQLGEFVVAIDPLITGVENNTPKVPVLIRDDTYPDPATNVGLWVVLLQIHPDN